MQNLSSKRLQLQRQSEFNRTAATKRKATRDAKDILGKTSTRRRQCRQPLDMILLWQPSQRQHRGPMTDFYSSYQDCQTERLNTVVSRGANR